MNISLTEWLLIGILVVCLIGFLVVIENQRNTLLRFHVIKKSIDRLTLQVLDIKKNITRCEKNDTHN